ncbi:MAG: DUF5681 domain-containing protein [Alphaproteobacteria bacterium]|nr:DUF5681 domain-containing protein [Alphaproteobacteria bacterium]
MPKFQKGHPGGPGRPRGSRNIANVLLDQLAIDGAEKMVRKMIEIAADGDRVAARLVLNRVWATPKGRSVQIDLPPIKSPADLVHAHAAVVASIAAEEITPQDGAALASVLETHRRAFELVAQEERVEKLEAEVRLLRERLACP